MVNADAILEAHSQRVAGRDGMGMSSEGEFAMRRQPQGMVWSYFNAPPSMQYFWPNVTSQSSDVVDSNQLERLSSGSSFESLALASHQRHQQEEQLRQRLHLLQQMRKRCDILSQPSYGKANVDQRSSKGMDESVSGDSTSSAPHSEGASTTSASQPTSDDQVSPDALLMAATSMKGSNRSTQFCSVCFGVRRTKGELFGGHRPDGYCPVKGRKASAEEKRELRRRRQKLRRAIQKRKKFAEDQPDGE